MEQAVRDYAFMAGPVLERLQRNSLIVGLVASGLALLGLFFSWAHFWQAYLLAYLFWLEITLGCLGLVLLHHLVGGRWSARIRRVLEAGMMTLPWLALLFLPLFIGLRTLYPWSDPAYVAEHALVQQKVGWLNIPFFVGRSLLYWAIWLGLAWLLNRWSLAQDQGDAERATRALRRLSPPGMILFGVTTTFAAFDWMMSLEPTWYSSIYGLLFIIGQALAALALAILGIVLLIRPPVAEADWRKTLNHLGNFLLGFVMIWAYFSFSQFLIIWSANLPEEAIWYVHRLQGGWQQVGILLFSFHFGLPFLLLLSRRIKRQAGWLLGLAGLIFAIRWVDLFWLLRPAFTPTRVQVSWLDAVLLLAIGGLWTSFFLRRWRSKSPLPLHDPQLASEVTSEQAPLLAQPQP